MLTTIWDDIDNEAEAVVIEDINYNPCSLSNILYDVIDDVRCRRKHIKEGMIKGLSSEINSIRSHRDRIDKSSNIQMLVEGLFKRENIEFIIPLDRVFLNAYYRRLLRAKLERDYIGKELVAGSIIINYTNLEIDAALVKTLRVFRLICKFLGITSTTHECVFPINKLYNPTFWYSVSCNLVSLFGEHRITIVEEDDEIDVRSVEAVIMTEMQKKHRQDQVLLMLNIAFNAWSGTTLMPVDNNNVKVLPATYVSRMLPKLRDF
jgi:hypothetical protein